MAQDEQSSVSCAEYKLDMQAAKFGYCVCGEAKQRHSPAALENQKSSKLSPDKFVREAKEKGEACEMFSLDLTRGFGQCRCGKAKAEHSAEAQLSGGKGSTTVKASRFHQLDARPLSGQTTRKTQSTRLFVAPPKPQRSVSAREAFLRGDLGKHSSSEPSFWTSGSSTTLLQGEVTKPSIEQSPRTKPRGPDVDLTYFRFLGGELVQPKESEPASSGGSQFRNPILMNELAAKLGVELSPRSNSSHEFLVPDDESAKGTESQDRTEAESGEGSLDSSVVKNHSEGESMEEPSVKHECDADETISTSSSPKERILVEEEDAKIIALGTDAESSEFDEEAPEITPVTITESHDAGSDGSDGLPTDSESQAKASNPSNEESASQASLPPDSDAEERDSIEMERISDCGASSTENDASDEDETAGDVATHIKEGDEEIDSDQSEPFMKDGDTQLTQDKTGNDDNMYHDRRSTKEIGETDEEPKWAAELEPTRINQTDQTYDEKKRKKVCCRIM